MRRGFEFFQLSFIELLDLLDSYLSSKGWEVFVIIFSNILFFCPFLPLFSFTWAPNYTCLLLAGLTQVSYALFISFPFFSLFRLDNLIGLSSSPLIPSLPVICCWISSRIFISVIILCFSTSEFPFRSFHEISSLILLVRNYSHDFLCFVVLAV